MKTLLSLLVISSFSVALAATNATAAAKKAVDPEAVLRKIYEEKLGGFVTKPGSQKGAIRIVNAQSRLAASELDVVVKAVKTQMEHALTVVSAKPLTELPTAADLKAADATLAVFVVDSPTLPVQLVAPEDRWALVNVAKLSAGLKDDVLGKRLFARRARGEVLRAFSLLCGGGSSMYPGNLFSASSVKQLDTLAVDCMVVDMVPRYEKYLHDVGVTPARNVTYHDACVEGWAAAPTNKFQKAVWDQVHKAPTAPIGIKPESTKRK